MTSKKTFKIDIYSCKITIIITENVMDEEEKLYIKMGEEPEDITPNDGLTIFFDNGHYYVMFKEAALSHNLIAHEIFHLTLAITENRTIDDEEAKAWLNGYLTELVYSYLNKINKEIKHGF